MEQNNKRYNGCCLDRRQFRRHLRVRGRADADRGSQRGHGDLLLRRRARPPHVSIRQRSGKSKSC